MAGCVCFGSAGVGARRFAPSRQKQRPCRLGAGEVQAESSDPCCGTCSSPVVLTIPASYVMSSSPGSVQPSPAIGIPKLHLMRAAYPIALQIVFIIKYTCVFGADAHPSPHRLRVPVDIRAHHSLWVPHGQPLEHKPIIGALCVPAPPGSKATRTGPSFVQHR